MIKEKPKLKNKWSESFYVLVYKLSLEGMSNKEIADALQCTENCLTKWALDKPGLAHALSEGRMTYDKLYRNRQTTLQDYIFGKLTPALRRVWKELNRIEKEPNSVHRINLLFEKNGETIRKYLFLHALSRTHFNASMACRKLCISKRTLEVWIEQDLQFADLVLEITFHKGQYFEGKLVELVERNNPQAIMMVNRTYNRDKGYGETLDVKHSGVIEHQQVFDISKLSMKLQQAILEETREIEEKKKKDLLLEDKS